MMVKLLVLFIVISAVYGRGTQNKVPASVVTEDLFVPAHRDDFVFKGNTSRSANRDLISKRGGRLDWSEPVRTGDYPFVARIMVSQQSNGYLCAGALITAKFVLTAKQCIEGKSAVTIQVGLGSVDGDSPTMVKVFVSQASWTFNGLIAPAVLRLASNVALNSNVNVIALPTVFGPEDWSQAAILGWCNSREYPWTTQFLRAVTPYFGPDFRNGEIWIVFSINFLDYGDEGAPFVTIENGIPVLRGLGFAWDWMWGSAEGYTALKAIEVKNHLQFISDVTGLPIRLS